MPSYGGSTFDYNDYNHRNKKQEPSPDVKRALDQAKLLYDMTLGDDVLSEDEWEELHEMNRRTQKNRSNGKIGDIVKVNYITKEKNYKITPTEVKVPEDNWCRVIE